MVRDIPGFYYDEEKGKYFRIQQNHRVVPGTGYTKQSVKEAEQAKKDQKRMQQQVRREKAGKIVRSSLLTNTTSPLAARFGASPHQNSNAVLKQYAAGLSESNVQIDNSGSDAKFLGSTFTISRSGMLCANYDPCRPRGQNMDFNFVPAVGECGAVDSPFKSFFDYSSCTPRTADIIAGVYDNVDAQCAVLSSAGSPSVTFTPVGAHGQPEPHFWLELNLGRWQVETVWDIAAAPSIPQAAIATDVGLIVAHYGGVNATKLMASTDLKSKEQMNVCFKDSNIAMSGERSGRINFTDVRAGRSVTRLLHSSAVLGTLSLHNENHVLAHGYSTTSVYDLRWVKQSPIGRRARFTDPTRWSQVYLDLAVPHGRHSDHYTRGRKVAYSSELDLVIAASSKTSLRGVRSFVTLYSASSGKVLGSPLTQHMYDDDVRHIEIRRTRDGPESIFCLTKDHIKEWRHAKLSRHELDVYGFDKSSVANKGLSASSFEQEWNRGNQR